jgi:hypothetical protein
MTRLPAVGNRAGKTRRARFLKVASTVILGGWVGKAGVWLAMAGRTTGLGTASLFPEVRLGDRVFAWRTGRIG